MNSKRNGLLALPSGIVRSRRVYFLRRLNLYMHAPCALAKHTVRPSLALDKRRQAKQSQGPLSVYSRHFTETTITLFEIKTACWSFPIVICSVRSAIERDMLLPLVFMRFLISSTRRYSLLSGHDTRLSRSRARHTVSILNRSPQLRNVKHNQ